MLEKHGIEVVVDVRSAPFSRYSPHFNHENLKLSIKQSGRKYLYLGRELGGMPKDESYYDEEGYVLYWKIAETPAFQLGIARLTTGVASYTVALMCGEEDPSHCHRRLLVGRALQSHGIELAHVRGNGSIQTDEQLTQQQEAPVKQMSLFEEKASAATAPQKPWRSSHPVARRNAD